MSEQTAPEPSMDEILASIRRIVSEDDAPVVTRTATVAAEPPPAAVVEPAAAAAAVGGAPLVSESASAITASAFDRLSSAAAVEDAPTAPPVAMPAPGRTLEDVVREMLRPMLQAWLEEHLPAIVQKSVDAEVERIARSRVR